VDLRLAVAAILALAAGAGVPAVTRPAPQVEVLVAETPLPPGVRLADLPVTTRWMTPLPGLVPADQAAALADHSLAAALAPGDPLLSSLLMAPPADRPDVAALTLDPAHAVQGDLVAGDHIDVYVSRTGTTELLAPDVVVLAAAAGSGGLGGSDVSLLLAVDRDLARALIEAIHTAEVDLVRRPR
jgi:hypothetical protein